MCGFAGVIAWEEKYRIPDETLARMSARIAHRGPDGAGTWISSGNGAKAQAALAHRRLAIIDPDPRANQPFADERGRQLVYNGEIYNFRELRKELSSLRPEYVWRTECDTEVLLVAYDAWAEQCCEKFNGMFALAIWDEREESLFLARDRMGQKPLYLSIAAGEAGAVRAVAFASELSALRVVPWVDPTIDFTAIGHYLRWGYIPCPRTAYLGCQKLSPAHWMRIDAKGIEVQRYFDPNARAENRVEATGDATRMLVSRAVQRQLVSDVPIGCFLSGGIDSSIVAAAMKASVPRDQDVLTFSIGFDDPRYDETAHAAEVARHLGTKHRQFIVRPDAASDLPMLAEVFGEPFADSSALPTHYLSRQTRAHVKVALSGDGGDELFGGYERYRAMLLSERWKKYARPLSGIGSSRWANRFASNHPKSRSFRARRLLRSMDLPPARRYDSYMRLFDDSTVDALLPVEDARTSANWLSDEFTAMATDRDCAAVAAAVDRVTYLPDDLLTKVDRASMLHALEVRSPFMDPMLVHFAANLSSDQMFDGKQGKRLLREAFANDLPGDVFRRRKMGFAVPIGDWLRNDLRGLLRDLLGASDSFAAKYLHRPTIDRLLAEHESEQADHSQRLYALLMLELWHRTFGR